MDERGFSLLDALIAAVILVTGIGALVQLFVIASQSATAAAQATMAATLAASKVEELRSLEWGDVRGGGDRIAEYTRTWSVEPLDAGAGAIVIQVAVMPGGAHLVTLRRRPVP